MKRGVWSVLAGLAAGLAITAAGGRVLFGGHSQMYWSRTQHLGAVAVGALAGAVTAALAVRLSRSRSLAYAAPGLLWPALDVWNELAWHEDAGFVAGVAAAGLLAVLGAGWLARRPRPVKGAPGPHVAA